MVLTGVCSSTALHERLLLSSSAFHYVRCKAQSVDLAHRLTLSTPDYNL